MPTSIILRSVTKSYSRGGETLRVLDGLDLEMDGGTFYALMGPSGSGKTTLLNLVGGLDHADDGVLQVGDEDLGLNAAAIADLCGDGIQGCPVPTHEHDIRSPRCEAAGVLRAEARACPGDQNGLRHCAQPISEQVIGVTEPRGRSPRTPSVSSA